MDRPDESLFEDTKMSFGDHIEELRVRLFKAVIGVVIGFMIGLYISDAVVIALQKPLRYAISEYKASVSRERNNEVDIYADEKRNDQDQPYEVKKVRLRPVELAAYSIGDIGRAEVYPFQFSEKELAAKQKIKELSALLSGAEEGIVGTIWSSLSEEDQETITAWSKESRFDQEDYASLAKILNRVVENNEVFLADGWEEFEEDLPKYAKDESFAEVGKKQHQLSVALSPFVAVPGSDTIELTMLIPARNETIATAIQGPFMIWLKTGFIVGLVVSAPWVFYQIWAFIAAGLYPHEKRYVHLYLPISVFLFVSGAAFAFYVVFQYVLEFLFTFNAMMGVSPDPRVNEYIGFVMILPLGFGVAFQLPIVMVFLNRFGIVSIESFLSKWRIAVLVIAVASMLLTPQDPISMLLMAIPLTLLYFVGILMCRFMPRGRTRMAVNEGYDPS